MYVTGDSDGRPSENRRRHKRRRPASRRRHKASTTGREGGPSRGPTHKHTQTLIRERKREREGGTQRIICVDIVLLLEELRQLFFTSSA